MTPPNTDRSAPFNLPTVGLTVLLAGAFFLAYFPVWEGLVRVWYTSDDYSHGFFILPVCAYIVWQKRERLAQIQVNPSGWGLAIVIVSLMIYLIAHLAEIATVKAFSMILVIAGAIVYFHGFRMLKELGFPLFLLLFMIPVPAQIHAKLTIPLQLFVSKASIAVCNVLGLPVYREGNVIHLPDRTLQVVQACSGLRSMTMLLTLSAIVGYLTLRSNVLRTILFVSGIPVAVLVNVIRVTLMVFAFYFFNYDLTAGTTHTVFGLVIFMIALLCLFLLKRVLSVWDRPGKPAR